MLHDPMHAFFKLPRPVHRPLQSPSGFLPKLYVPPFFPVRIAESEHLVIDTKYPLGPWVASLLTQTRKVCENAAG